MLNIFQRKKSAEPASPESSSEGLGAATSLPPTPGIPIASAENPTSAPPIESVADNSKYADIVLKNINDGVVIVNKSGIIEFVNPAAVTMLDCGEPSNAIGLDYSLLFPLEAKDGQALNPDDNMLVKSFSAAQPMENFQCVLLSGTAKKRIPISVNLLPVRGGSFIITFRSITKELAEEGEQTEFISTASHEMRTPVATIDGYITLALNPQTATIDERARGYLESASKASKHLGKLFQDLLDTTKLDDGRIRPELVPVEMVSTVKQIASDHAMKAHEANLNFSFGANEQKPQDDHRLEQMVYASVDVNFLREIMDNLLDNAIKYTPSGGSIYVNVLGDGDRVLINVTDTGIGVSATDLQHIFQKFYRADNSDTREIGGTGLGLYLVKQRVEAMGGRVWAESAFGEGTTFYVSLPRISAEEYQKRLIAVQSAKMMGAGGVSATLP
ncbi:MAG: PAS domain-containing sensor histidine kinase [Candidatus Saccharibacteria bacterium]|nr:PAS domain-containing sensor histidine kinase [Candidatus Saccharibacteria bacterium]